MRILGFILFFVLLLLLGSIGVKAQVQATGSVTQLVYQRGGYGADSVFGMPVRDTFCNNFPAFRCRGRMTIQPATYQVYINDGTYWRAVGAVTPTDSSVFVTITYLNNVLDDYVEWADTSTYIATRHRLDSLLALYVPSSRTLTIQGVAQDLSANRTWSFTTSDIPEGSNQYFTQSRARQSISVSGGLLSYDNTTGVIGLTAAILNGSYWALGGNAIGSVQSMGATSAQPVTFITNNTVRDSIAPNGVRTMGTSTMPVENLMNLRSSTAARFRWFIGLNGIFSTNALVLRFDNAGDNTVYSEISSSSGTFTLTSQAITLRPMSGTVVPPILVNEAGSLGEGLRVAPRIAWTSSFAPTNGTTTMVVWGKNSPNTHYTPSSGGHVFRWNVFDPIINATGTYAGLIQGYVFNPTVTSIASGTLRAFESTHNTGYANYHSGTALNHFNGRALFGTLTDNTVDQIQSAGAIRGTFIKSTNMNAGDLSTDSIVVYNSATDEFRRGAPLSSAITSVLYETYGSGSVQTTNATPATIATIAVPTNNTTLSITFEVTGKTATTGRVANLKRAYVTNNGGTLTLIGGSVVTPTPTQRDAPLTTADFTVTTSGTNALIQVTGEAATTINWNCTYKYNTN